MTPPSAQHTLCTWSRVYNYVQKAGGESAGESKKPIAERGGFRLKVSNVVISQREGKGVPGDSCKGRDGATRADGGQLVYGIWKVRVPDRQRIAQP